MARSVHVVVAGGAGFVGSHLCDALLARDARVTCIDNFQTGRRSNVGALESHPGFEMIEADVVDLTDLPGPIHRIYNLASPASPPHYQADPVRTMMTNVVGTGRLLALAERHGARLMQASTSEVYGDPETHPQREDYRGNVSCTGPRACYDEGKRAAETLCFDYLRAGRADVRVARVFNTYGPRMRADDGRIISNFLVQALTDRAMTIYGDGSQTRSFCYVSDLVAGFIALMEADGTPDGPVNLGNPAEFTILELAEEVRRIVPTVSRPVTRPLPVDDPRRRRPDISRARALLGWEPKVPLAEGLRLTASWFAAELAERERAAYVARRGGGRCQREAAMNLPLRKRIEQLGPWFHNLRLNGIETAPDHPLGDYPSFKWRGFARVVPESLEGLTVLDIGCNAGFYAIEMARRGAAVVAIDSDPRYLAQAALAAEVTGARVELHRMSVYDVERLGRRFDLVLFMGVFYHLRHPLLALDLLWQHVVGDRLLFQSMQRGAETPVAPAADYPFEDEAVFEQPGWPRLSFVERRYARDPTNWFVPNRAAAEAMLRSAGFRIEAHPEPEVYLCSRAERGEAVEPPPRIAPPG